MLNAVLRPLVLVLVLLLSGCVSQPAVAPGEPGNGRAPLASGEVGETLLFTRVGDPGLPEGIAIHDGRVFVTVSQDAHAYGEILVHDLATAALEERIRVAKRPAAFGGTSRLLGIAVAAAGDLFVADTGDPRILRVDGATRAIQVYAAIPDLPPCPALVVPGECAPTALDEPPVPNWLAFAPNGDLYVTDIAQAVVFRIPWGGGEAEIWFSDARLGSFGANGLAFSPDGAHVYLAHSYLEGFTPIFLGTAGGALYRLPFVEEPAFEDLELIRHFPRYAIDGIALGGSGDLYVTMLGQSAAGQAEARHGIARITPDGEDVAFLPTEAQASRMEIPYDFPASIAFDDARRSILVTNQAFAEPEHWAVLETYVDDVGLPLHKP